MAQRVLRPLSYGDLFDELFDLYKKHFLLFVGIAGVVTIPIYAIGYAIGGAAASAAAVLAGLLTFVVMAATTWAVSRCYLGQEVSIVDSYKAIGRRAVPFVFTMIAVEIFIGLGFLCLIVPGVILMFRWAFVSEVYVIECKSGGDARKRSKELAAGNSNRIFVVSLLAAIIVWIIQWILLLPITFMLGSGPSAGLGGVGGMILGLAMGISGAVTSPIAVIAFVLLYYDVRVRKEGFDIAMLANDMSLAAGEVSAPNPVTPG